MTELVSGGSVFEQYLESKIFPTEGKDNVTVIEADEAQLYLKFQVGSDRIVDVFLDYEAKPLNYRNRSGQEIVQVQSIEEVYVGGFMNRSIQETDFHLKEFNQNGVEVTVDYQGGQINNIVVWNYFTTKEGKREFYEGIQFKKFADVWKYRFDPEDDDHIFWTKLHFDQEIKNPIISKFSSRVAQERNGKLIITGSDSSSHLETVVIVQPKIDQKYWDDLLWQEDRNWRDFRREIPVSMAHPIPLPRKL